MMARDPVFALNTDTDISREVTLLLVLPRQHCHHRLTPHPEGEPDGVLAGEGEGSLILEWS